MKKLWNWRLLAVIAALAVLTWFAFLYADLDAYNSLKTHGSYGKYEDEMFDLYGETLSSDELADYDLPGKLATVYEEADAIIAQNPVFAKYGIADFAGYLEFDFDLNSWEGETEPTFPVDRETFYDEGGDGNEMRFLLEGGDNATLDEWYDSPQMKYQTLHSLQFSFEDYQENLEIFMEHDTRPVVARVAKEILEKDKPNEPSLVRYDLIELFSSYAATVGVFVVLAALLLVAPPLTNDRARKITLLQYSSKTGRKITRYKFAATLASVLIMSAVLVSAAYIIFIVNDAFKFRDANLMSFNAYVSGGSMYNVTFGQYVIILAAVSVVLALAAACAAFALARFSSSVVNLMIKIVPVGAAVSAITALALLMCFTYNNIIFNALQGRFDMPEIWTSAILAIVCLATAVVVAIREKHADVM
jgi:hypothetical protein